MLRYIYYQFLIPGALGFLKIPGVETTGNFGFYDQRLTLEWVQDNIQYLGGNLNKVTRK